MTENDKNLETIRSHAWCMLENVYEESKTGDEASRKMLLEHWDDLSFLFLLAGPDTATKDKEVLFTVRHELVESLLVDFPTRSEIPDMKELGLGEVTVTEFFERRKKGK